MKYKYKEIMEESSRMVREFRANLKRLEGCNTVRCKRLHNMISAELKVELAARKKAKKIKVDVLKVNNIYGEDTKITASPVLKEVRSRDYAILEGDFKKFDRLGIAQGFDIHRGDTLRSCGYAGAKTPPICTDFIAGGNYRFNYYGYGYLMKGMSGGPVINKYGLVVGINASVGNNEIFMSPIVGVFNRYFKRPKPKPKKIMKPLILRAKDR